MNEKVPAGAAGMKSHPMIFSGPMVQALLEGHKTQTRRLVKPQPSRRKFWHWQDIEAADEPSILRVCVQGSRIQPGDEIWVRETWGIGTRPCPFEGWIDGVEYRADEAYLDEYDILDLYKCLPSDWEPDEKSGWRPSIHMPRWASRLTLHVTNVRAQRLQDISEEDAVHEGCGQHCPKCGYTRWDNEIHADHRLCGEPLPSSSVEAFAKLWNTLHTKPGTTWTDNPVVWAYTFEVKA